MHKIFKLLLFLIFQGVVCVQYLQAEFVNGDGFYEVKKNQKIELNKLNNLSTKKKFDNVTTFIIKKDANALQKQPEVEYQAYFFDDNEIELKSLLPSNIKKIKGIKSLKFKNLLIITPINMQSKKPEISYSATIKKENIPKDIIDKFGKWKDIKVSSSSNATFKAIIDKKINDELANLLSLAGIELSTFDATGHFAINPVKVDGYKPPTMQPDEYIKDFTLEMDLPVATIKGLDKYIKLEDVVLGVNLSDYSTSPWNKLPDSLKLPSESDSLNYMLTANGRVSVLNQSQESAFLIDFGKAETDGTSTKKTLSLLSMTKESIDFTKIASLDFLPFADDLKSKVQLGYQIKISETKEDKKTKDAKIDLSGFGGINIKGKDIDFIIDFLLNGTPNSSKTVKFNYVELDDNLKFSDIVGSSIDGKELPKFIKDLSLEKVKIASGGLEVETKIFELDSTMYLFKGKGKGVNFAFDLKDFSLSSLLPSSSSLKNNSHIKEITLPKAAIIYSTHGLIGTINDVSAVAKDAVKDVFGKNSNKINIASGLSLAGQFSLQASGTFGKKIIGIATKGVNLGFSETAFVMGTLPGVLGTDGDFGINLNLLMDTKVAIKPPKAFKLNADVAPGFFIKIQTDDFKIGVDLDFSIDDGKTVLMVEGGLGVGVDEEGVDLLIYGIVNDNWKNPFGIYEQLEIENVSIDGIIKDDGTIHLGIGGKTSISDTELTVGAALNFNVVERLPDGVALKVGLDDLDYLGYYYLYLLVSGYESPIKPYCAQSTCSRYFPSVSSEDDGDISVYYSEDCASDYLNNKTIKTKYSYSKITSQEISSKVDQCIKDQPAKNDSAKGWAKKWAKKDAKVLTINDTYLSFATPGAEDPILGIGSGVSFGADLNIHGTELGNPHFFMKKKYVDALFEKVKSAKKDLNLQATANSDIHSRRVSTIRKNSKDRELTSSYSKAKSTIDLSKYNKTKKISDITQTINDFSVGPITFTNNKLHQDPLLVESKVKLFGNTASLGAIVKLEKDKLFFNSTIDFDTIGKADLTFKYDSDQNDYLIIGDLTENNDLQKFLKNEITQGVKEISNEAKNLYPTLQKAYTDAKKVSDEFYKELQDAKKNYKVADDTLKRLGLSLKSDIQKLKQDADNTKSKYEEYKSKCKNTSKYEHPYEKGKYCTKEVAYYGDWQIKEKSYEAARDALTTAQNLDNKLQSLLNMYNEKAIITAAKKAESDTVSQAKDMIDKQATNFINQAEEAGDMLEIEQVLLVGSYNDIKNNLPFVVDISFKIKDKEYKKYFAFYPANPAQNAKSFGLLPALVIDNLIEEEFKQKYPKVTNWIHAHIFKLLNNLKEKMQEDLSQEEEKYSSILKSMDETSDLYVDGYNDVTQEINNAFSSYSIVDFMPQSKLFNDKYLVVGHSSLCLGVALNGVDVYQENCQDVQSERWSAVDVGNGYIQLKSKGLCLKAKTTGDGTFSEEFLALSECNGKDEHEKWKIVSEDGYWDKIVNKYSEKCLHFDIESANPKTAYATWTGCVGMASEMFRDIEDTQRPTYHNVEDLIDAKNGTCLSTKKSFDQYFFEVKRVGNISIKVESKKGNLTTTAKEYEKMISKEDNVLISTACESAIEDKFNYIEELNGDLKLIHAQSGWCVTPNPKDNKSLVLQPCNKEKNILWTNIQEGNSFQLKSNVNNKCITLGVDLDGNKIGKAELSQCVNSSGQDIDFVK
ncbi:ricin-type beta-trefoil lectin domain protein [Halarcobacter ebronensis]|uniref:Ricin B lectin domain-containing protein n=1 Tax=Halarcobacter ebronensis TaxID=1462615 RepID=A0A4Q1AKL9_9BACT|nr:ricin-type beta-trefoil lectin domain protein [Halarcobacter ebronensis]QKF83078.1 ricin-type beta-trefoil lectin domain-containing protein [Halarcobacter ebronensis]RXK02407.1 hypothetical protein CRV07_13765 [Halarcobacter ebronensis]